MRRLFTTAEAALAGTTIDALKWGVRAGAWVRVVRGVYGDGPEPPSPLDVERAQVLARGTVGRGALAGVLLGLDAVQLDGRPTRERHVEVGHVIGGIPVATALQTLIDLAALLDDDRWEQALESALRKRLVAIDDLVTIVPELEAQRLPGVARIRRVLAKRPAATPPTESLLETIAVQVARTVPGLEVMTRQHEVYSRPGLFVARVDLCVPELGVFFELDGQHHAGQPVYDVARETAVVGATGWLPGRFTWYELVHVPRSSARRMGDIVWQAGRRAA